jgi:hypothetical protein
MYESPFSVSFMEEIEEGIAKEIGEWIDDSIMKATVDAKITVDKDELVKALAYDRGQYDKGYGDGYQDGKRYAWEWISVEERMPPCGRDVLVATCGGYISIDALRTDGKGWIDHGCITHWMPLPEPPKEVE